MSGERLASWALAAAFVAVVGLAALDALRSSPPAAAPAATTTALPEPDGERLRARLRGERVEGRLVVTAPTGCGRTTWSLPELVRVSVDDACSAPLPEQQPPLPRSVLERAALRHPDAPLPSPRLRVLVSGFARLAGGDVAVLLGLRRSGRPDLKAYALVAFFTGSRLRATSPVRGDLSTPDANPRQGYVGFVPGIVLRADGSDVSLPPFLRRSHALAWSPDGRWLALAQRAGVVLVSVESMERYDVTGSGLRTIDLPLEAGALEWR